MLRDGDGGSTHWWSDNDVVSLRLTSLGILRPNGSKYRQAYVFWCMAAAGGRDSLQLAFCLRCGVLPCYTGCAWRAGSAQSIIRNSGTLDQDRMKVSTSASRRKQTGLDLRIISGATCIDARACLADCPDEQRARLSRPVSSLLHDPRSHAKSRRSRLVIGQPAISVSLAAHLPIAGEVLTESRHAAPRNCDRRLASSPLNTGQGCRHTQYVA